MALRDFLLHLCTRFQKCFVNLQLDWSRHDVSTIWYEQHHGGTGLGISLLPDKWMQLWRRLYAVHQVSSKLACPRGAERDALDHRETWD